jgi:GTP pyrophosphokinase
VRHWFREQERDQAIHAGREILRKELSRVDLKRTKLEELPKALGLASLDDLYAAVGYGDKSAQLVVGTALQLERAGAPEAEPAPLRAPKPRTRSTSGLSLDGVSDVLGNRARCCSPLPGDAVVGFVTRGRGLVIHRRDCANVHDSPEPERWVDVDWGPEAREGHAVQIEVLAQDGPALLGELTRLAGALGAKVFEARSEPSARGVRLRLAVETRSAGQLASLLQRLRGARDVQDVRLVS